VEGGDGHGRARLRHTVGTDMARSGVRLPILQRMMGHASPETTLQYVNLSRGRGSPCLPHQHRLQDQEQVVGARRVGPLEDQIPVQQIHEQRW